MHREESEQPTTAAALFYDGENAPIISARGTGQLAEEIIALAQQHNIPLYENAELVELLSTLDIGDEIPRALFITIAEIIAFAYVLQDKTPEGWEEPGVTKTGSQSLT